MDDQGFIWAVCVDANSAVVKDGVRELSTLPEYIAVTLKLAWVRGLQKEKKRGQRCPQDINVNNTEL